MFLQSQNVLIQSFGAQTASGKKTKYSGYICFNKTHRFLYVFAKESKLQRPIYKIEKIYD